MNILHTRISKRHGILIIMIKSQILNLHGVFGIKRWKGVCGKNWCSKRFGVARLYAPTSMYATVSKGFADPRQVRRRELRQRCQSILIRFIMFQKTSPKDHTARFRQISDRITDGVREDVGYRDALQLGIESNLWS